MISLAFTKFMSFFSRQFGLLISVSAGILLLVGLKRYVETNAVTRDRKRELQDALNRIKENREFKDDHEIHINGLHRDALIDVMRKNGELYDPQDRAVGIL